MEGKGVIQAASTIRMYDLKEGHLIHGFIEINRIIVLLYAPNSSRFSGILKKTRDLENLPKKCQQPRLCVKKMIALGLVNG